MSYLKGLAEKINGVEKQSFTQELDINSLVPSSNNFYGIREIEELAESIKENGLMHNLVVRKKDNDNYEIISGERRFHALKSLDYKQVPCLIKDELSDLDAELILIKANINQRELTASEKMQGINRLKAIYEEKKANGEQLPKGKVRDLIGQDMKLSGVQVGRYQKVDKDLIEPLKEKLDKEEITLTQAHTLSSLRKDEQKVIHEEIKDLDSKESKEEIEVLVQGIKQPIESKLDKELLNEMYSQKVDDKPKPKAKVLTTLSEEYSTDSKPIANNDILYKLQETFDIFAVNPKFIISNQAIKGIFYTSEIKFNDSTLDIKLAGFGRISFMNIKPSIFEKVEEIEVEEGKIITPKHGYKIAEDVYIWFNKKHPKIE